MSTVATSVRRGTGDLPSPLVGWLAVLALTTGIFSIVYLLGYGVAGVVGNVVGGATVTRGLRATLCLAAAMIAGATLLLPLLGRTDIGAIVLLVVWGLAYGAVPVCAQTWFVRSAPRAIEAATVLFTSSFQATIAIGALLGGVVVDAASTSTVMVLGGTAAVLAAVTVLAGGGVRSAGTPADRR
jgi:predicted MFS family arabinose efflux permease